MKLKNMQYTQSNIKANKIVAYKLGYGFHFNGTICTCNNFLAIHFVRQGVMDGGASFAASLNAHWITGMANSQGWVA